MEWQGYNSIESLVERKVTEAAIKNPGPMRPMTVRLPVSSEARLVVIAEMLRVPKSTLLRDLLMTALLEAEDNLKEMIFETDEDRQHYQNEVERTRFALMESVEGQDIGIAAQVTAVRRAGEGEA